MPVRFRFLRFATTWKLAATTPKFDPDYGYPDQPQGTLGKTQHATELDGWACRDEFFRLPREEAAYLNFLSKVGLWYPVDFLANPTMWHPGGQERTGAPFFEEHDHPEVRGSDVWTFRDSLRNALMRPEKFIADYARGRYATGRPIFELADKVPVLVIETICFTELLAVTIWADLVQGFHFQQCKRKDCGMPFVIETAHKRKYCSQYCGHLESMRRQRRIAKTAKGAQR